MENEFDDGPLDINDIIGEIEQNNNDFIDDIRQYWSIVTSFDSVEEMMMAPIESIKRKFPNVPSSEWDALLEEYNIPAMEGDFLNQFMRHFSHDEVKELLKLYKTNPLLNKSKNINKEIREESYQLNEKWIYSFNDLLMKKINEWLGKGYIQPPSTGDSFNPDD